MSDVKQHELMQFMMQFFENMWFTMPGTCMKYYHEGPRMDVEIKLKRITGKGMLGEQTLDGTVCYNAPVVQGRTRDFGDREAYHPGDMVQIAFNSRSTEMLYDDLQKKVPAKYMRLLHENDAVIMGGHTPDKGPDWPNTSPATKAPKDYADNKLIWYALSGNSFMRVEPSGLVELFTKNVIHLAGMNGPKDARIGDLVACPHGIGVIVTGSNHCRVV